MSAGEKQEARFARMLSPEGVEFQNPEAEASYKARVNRLKDAIQLEKTPDRVPIIISGTFLQTNLYGISPYESMYDYAKLLSAHKQFLLDYQPDFHSKPAFAGSGRVFEALGLNQYSWPGHGVSENSAYQYEEREYMKAEDYPALINDPTDFWLRTWMPRAFGGLAGLSNLAPFPYLWEIIGMSPQMIPFGLPNVQDALKALMAAGNEALAWIKEIQAFTLEAMGMGFPAYSGGATKAPFDVLADTLRGTRGIMLDMYRQPDMVLKAIERITPIYIKQGLDMADRTGNPIIFIPLHKGADGFMSDEHFRRFYWPSLKEVILRLAEEGCVPYLFCEGSYNSRLKYLKELPKASCFWIFDRTDMAKAKEEIGDTLCIGGNVPAGMIVIGTAEKVEEYCRSLIETAGHGGGYIMAFGSALDEGKADTIQAMIKATKKYGVYRQTA